MIGGLLLANPLFAMLVVLIGSVFFFGSLYNVIINMSDEDWNNFEECLKISFGFLSGLIGLNELAFGDAAAKLIGPLEVIDGVVASKELSEGSCK